MVTYRLGVTLKKTGSNLYSLVGSGKGAMAIPAAYQTAIAGSNTGGISAGLLKAIPDTKFDSWLTVGLTNGESGVGSAGIKWKEWTASKGFSSKDCGVFWMNPAKTTAKGSGKIVVAQLTLKKDAKLAVTMGMVGKEKGGKGWREDKVLFGDSSPPPPPPPSGGKYEFVTPYVDTMSWENSKGMVTYRLGVTLKKSGSNLYSLVGSGKGAMDIPAAYQTAIAGSNIGGISAGIVKAIPDTKFDSWLTVGITNGDSGLGSAGIKWKDWTASKGFSSKDCGVFWMNPAKTTAKGSGKIVVAQLTLKKGAKLAVTMGMVGKEKGGKGWREDKVSFAK